MNAMRWSLKREVDQELEQSSTKFNAELACEEYRRDSYKLLSECYYLPDRTLLGTLNNLDTRKGHTFSELAKHRPKISDLGSLAIDYSKLFVGPYELLAAPYGSLYLEDSSRVMGDSTLDVRERYAEEGLDIGLKEAPDHVAIELEFMYLLVFREVEAIKLADFETANSHLERQKAFLETHLGMWVSEFANRVLSSAETVFYRDLAHLTKLFVEEDLEYLSNNLLVSSLHA